MAKEYLVLKAERGDENWEVVYQPGHYDIQGARETMRQDARAHPQRCYRIVHIQEQYFDRDFA